MNFRTTMLFLCINLHTQLLFGCCSREQILINDIYAAACSTSMGVENKNLTDSNVMTFEQKLKFIQRTLRLAYATTLQSLQSHSNYMKSQNSRNIFAFSKNEEELKSWRRYILDLDSVKNMHEQNLKKKDSINKIKQRAESDYFKNVAYHEAGHAHVIINLDAAFILNYVAVNHFEIPVILELLNFDNFEGVNHIYATSEKGSSFLTNKQICNRISVYYAGGIAEQIFRRKYSESTLNSLLSVVGLYSYDFYSEEDAMKDFYTLMGPGGFFLGLGFNAQLGDVSKIIDCCAVYYQRVIADLQRENKPIIEQDIKEQIKQTLHDCYGCAYNILHTHQEQVEKTVAALQEKSIITGKEVYQHGGKTRLKFFFEEQEYIEDQSARKIQSFMRAKL